MRGLTDKVIVVTGAGSGLGRGMAYRLAEEQASVAVLDLNRSGAEETVAKLAHPGLAVEVDITDYVGCERAIDAVEAALGPVDVLVNNAGWDAAAPFLDTAAPSSGARSWRSTCSARSTCTTSSCRG